MRTNTIIHSQVFKLLREFIDCVTRLMKFKFHRNTMNDYRAICQKISYGFNTRHRSCHSRQQQVKEGCWVLFYLIMNEETWKNR